MSRPVKKIPLALILSILLLACYTLSGQTFYFGNDLSYVNQMEDCGAVYKEKNVPKDVFQIFADHGTNLVRVRLWYEPTWQNDLVQPDGVKPQYSDFEDVKETIRRSKKAGMQVMLDLHLSDFWADPGKQIIPARWVASANDTASLADSVYNYVSRILTSLDHDTLMPEIVKVGNENNGGILRHTILNSDFTAGGSVSSSWGRHSHFYKAAIRAIRDVGSSAEINPKICLHYAGLSWVASWYQNLMNYGVTDFDIIGFSYYYAWHGASIQELGSTIEELKTTFPGYEVMVAETGYLWTTQDFDDLENIAVDPDPAYLPVIPEKQLEYMVDYTREVIRSGGSGVIFWEPAWVSTPCTTPWGKGSSHDHLVFFDPVNTNFMENGGGKWTESRFYENPDYRKVTFKVNTSEIEVNDKMYISGTMTGDPWVIQPMYPESENLYSFTTYLAAGDSGAFYFLNDSSWDARESVPQECAEWWGTDRGYKIGLNDTIITYKWGTCLPADAPPDIQVTFKVDMTGEDVSGGVWITGSMTGEGSWEIIPMQAETGNIYSKTFVMHPGDSGAYYFMNDNVWGDRETVPVSCATWWGSDRGYKIEDEDTTYAFIWGTCLPVGSVNNSESPEAVTPILNLFPNPSDGEFAIVIAGVGGKADCRIIDFSGRILISRRISCNEKVNLAVNLSPGSYLVQVENENYLFNEILNLY
jgi:arabinogalactan endo-1,4-beta-galactosidase